MNTNQSTEMTLFIPNTEAIGQLMSMDKKFSLNTKYKSADDWASIKDKPLRCYYLGVKDIPNEEGEAINCGVFASEREVFLSGQKVLVDAVKNLKEKTALEITYRGKKSNKSTDGSTMLFDVEMLG